MVCSVQKSDKIKNKSMTLLCVSKFIFGFLLVFKLYNFKDYIVKICFNLKKNHSYRKKEKSTPSLTDAN